MKDMKQFAIIMAQACIVYGKTLESPERKQFFIAYWEACGALSDAQFKAGMTHAMKVATFFPPPAAILAAAYGAKEERDARQAREGPTPDALRLQAGAMIDAGKRNAARLAREGLPSDRVQWKRVTHTPGSTRHGEILHAFDRMLESLELTVNLRRVELDTDPGNPELARRFGVLTHTLANVARKRAHFAGTGDMRDDEPLPPDLTPPVDVTVFYHCPDCKDDRFVRVDVPFATPHFGKAIPCPRCNATAYDAYVGKHGIPAGMPAWFEAGAAR
jgi:hypothetical protein